MTKLGLFRKQPFKNFSERHTETKWKMVTCLRRDFRLRSLHQDEAVDDREDLGRRRLGHKVSPVIRRLPEEPLGQVELTFRRAVVFVCDLSNKSRSLASSRVFVQKQGTEPAVPTSKPTLKYPQSDIDLKNTHQKSCPKSTGLKEANFVMEGTKWKTDEKEIRSDRDLNRTQGLTITINCCPI